MRYKGTRFYLFIFLLTGLFTSVVVTAYSQSAPYINYSVKDGLPSSEVYHVMQDSKGYMWFSTNRGVSRFNGVTFKSFTPGDGLADPVILESVEDYKGRIWFRSLSGKLSYFYHDSIFRLPVNDTIFSLLKGKIPMSLSIDTSDNVYLSGYNLDGIITINLKNNCSVSFMPLHCRYTYIAIPPSGQILSGNAAPRATYNRGPDSASLYVFTISNKSPNLIKNLYSRPGIQKALSSVHDNAVHLPGGEIALSYINKLILYNNGSVKYMHDFDYEILKIFPDKTGKLWIILENEAPVYYENGEIVEPLTLKFLKDEGISSVSDDNEGGLWFTTLNHGIYYIGSTDFKVWNTENGLPFDKANFVGVMPGHYIFASSIVNKQVAVILHDTLTCHNVPYETLSSNITGAMFNSDKTIWIGSTLGTIIINNLKSFNVLPSTYFNIANSSMISNPDGTVWVLGKYNLYLVNVINGMFTILKYFPLKMPAAAFCTNNHRGLWLASINGLWEYVNDSLKYYGDKYPGLKHDMKFVRESADGHIWMATRDTGVIMMYKGALTHLTTGNGLLSNFCTCLCIDYRGNLWVGTNKGLSHIITHTGPNGECKIDKISNISATNLNEVNYIACDSNIIYVASNNGLTSFDMNKVETNNTPPPVYITSVKINNKPEPNSTRSFRLSYNQNYIALTYTGITYRNGANTQYRYKMEGIDTGWVYTRYTSVQYPELAPGNYTFKVSAMNNDGVWSATPAEVSFTVLPPFWATWWARGAFILLIAGLIYARIKTVEKREKKKTEVNKQLASFELKELKAQLDPHFLFNSLNTLTQLVEENPAQAPEFVEELSEFYRYTLLHRNTEFTELSAETEQGERYLKLLAIRFGDQLRVKWNIDKTYTNYLLPTNSLQLLLENITKHNIILPDSPLQVEIFTGPGDLLTIKNQLRQKETGAISNGIGLKSINERYRLLANKKITVVSTNENFSVELPLISHEEYENINY